MITENTQVRLSISLQGRLGAPVSNTSNRKETIVKKGKNGKKFTIAQAKTRKLQECFAVVDLSPESVNFFVSDEGRPIRTAPSTWKKAGWKERLETNLQINADYIAGFAGAKYSYKLID